MTNPNKAKDRGRYKMSILQPYANSGAEAFSKLKKEFAISYGVSDVSKKFAIEPSIAQVLDRQITDKSDFLQKISMLAVTEMSGQKILMKIARSITSRTDTKSGGKRKPVYVGDLDELGYQLAKTNSDIAIDFDTIDKWAKFPNFREMYSDEVQHQIALDRIKIGWNGTHVAANTDIVTNPLLQDVNKGWLQYVREKAAGQILTEGATAGKITIGDTGDYKNLDALVYDIKNGIHLNFRGGGDLVAIVGEDLLHREGLKYYSMHGSTPTEKAMLQTQQITEVFGTLPTYLCPYFPAKGLVVTSFDNLAIYWQETSWRRFLIDNPSEDQYEDYLSRNEGYAVQQVLKFAAIEADNVQFV